MALTYQHTSGAIYRECSQNIFEGGIKHTYQFVKMGTFSLTSCVTLGKSLTLSELQFLQQFKKKINASEEALGL